MEILKKLTFISLAGEIASQERNGLTDPKAVSRVTCRLVTKIVIPGYIYIKHCLHKRP